MECKECNKYKRKADKYKKRYELAKSGLVKEERDLLVELICNEQLKYMIANGKHDTDEYKKLEELKVKIKVI